MKHDSSPIRVGIVALGRSGWDIHLPLLLKDPLFSVVAAVEPLAERREEATRVHHLRCYESLDEMLQGETLELVVVTSPSSFHYQDAMKVMAAGCHCVLEKPMASRCGDAESLAREAAARKLHLLVFHNHVFAESFFHFKEVVDSGVLGDLFGVRICFANYMRRWDWQTLKKNGGGYLSNFGSHALSVALPLLGEPISRVDCNVQLVKNAGDAEDHVDILLRTVSGRTANITVSSAMAISGPRYLLLGQCGTLSSDGQTSQLRYLDGDIPPLPEVIDAAAPGRKFRQEELQWKEELIPSKPRNQHVGFYGNVAAVLRKGAAPVVSVESALEVLRILERAQEAALRR